MTLNVQSLEARNESQTSTFVIHVDETSDFQVSHIVTIKFFSFFNDTIALFL